MTDKYYNSKGPEKLKHGEWFDCPNDCRVSKVVYKNGDAFCPNCRAMGCVYKNHKERSKSEIDIESRAKIIKTGLNLITQRVPEMDSKAGRVMLITYQAHVSVLIPDEMSLKPYLNKGEPRIINHNFTPETAESLGYVLASMVNESSILFQDMPDSELQERVARLLDLMLGGAITKLAEYNKMEDGDGQAEDSKAGRNGSSQN